MNQALACPEETPLRTHAASSLATSQKSSMARPHGHPLSTSESTMGRKPRSVPQGSATEAVRSAQSSSHTGGNSNSGSSGENRRNQRGDTTRGSNHSKQKPESQHLQPKSPSAWAGIRERHHAPHASLSSTYSNHNNSASSHKAAAITRKMDEALSLAEQQLYGRRRVSGTEGVSRHGGAGDGNEDERSASMPSGCIRVGERVVAAVAGSSSSTSTGAPRTSKQASQLVDELSLSQLPVQEALTFAGQTPQSCRSAAAHVDHYHANDDSDDQRDGHTAHHGGIPVATHSAPPIHLQHEHPLQRTRSARSLGNTSVVFQTDAIRNDEEWRGIHRQVSRSQFGSRRTSVASEGDLIWARGPSPEHLWRRFSDGRSGGMNSDMPGDPMAREKPPVWTARGVTEVATPRAGGAYNRRHSGNNSKVASEGRYGSWTPPVARPSRSTTHTAKPTAARAARELQPDRPEQARSSRAGSYSHESAVPSSSYRPYTEESDDGALGNEEHRQVEGSRGASSVPIKYDASHFSQSVDDVLLKYSRLGDENGVRDAQKSTDVPHSGLHGSRYASTNSASGSRRDAPHAQRSIYRDSGSAGMAPDMSSHRGVLHSAGGASTAASDSGSSSPRVSKDCTARFSHSSVPLYRHEEYPTIVAAAARNQSASYGNGVHHALVAPYPRTQQQQHTSKPSRTAFMETVVPLVEERSAGFGPRVRRLSHHRPGPQPNAHEAALAGPAAPTRGAAGRSEDGGSARAARVRYATDPEDDEHRTPSGVAASARHGGNSAGRGEEKARNRSPRRGLPSAVTAAGAAVRRAVPSAQEQRLAMVYGVGGGKTTSGGGGRSKSRSRSPGKRNRKPGKQMKRDPPKATPGVSASAVGSKGESCVATAAALESDPYAYILTRHGFWGEAAQHF